MQSTVPFNKNATTSEYVVTGVSPWSNSDYTMLDLREGKWDDKTQILVVVKKDAMGGLDVTHRITADWNYIEMIPVPNMQSKIPLIQSFEILGKDCAMKFGVGVTNGL